MKLWMAYLVLFVVGGAGYYLTSPTAKADDPTVQSAAEEQRLIDCRARFDNFLLRGEELVKPRKERWEAFHAYMGRGCLR